MAQKSGISLCVLRIVPRSRFRYDRGKSENETHPFPGKAMISSYSYKFTRNPFLDGHLSKTELFNLFKINCLRQEYFRSGIDVRMEPGMTLKYPLLTFRDYGTKFRVLPIPSVTFLDEHKAEVDELVREAEARGAFLRALVVEAFDMEDLSSGENTIEIGKNYVFRYSPISLHPQKEIPEPEMPIRNYDLVRLFAEAVGTGDFQELLPLTAPDVVFSEYDRFDEIIGRDEFLSILPKFLKKYRLTRLKEPFRLVRDRQTGELGLRFRYGSDYFVLLLECQLEFVSSVRLEKNSRRFRVYNTETDPVMCRGDYLFGLFQVYHSAEPLAHIMERTQPWRTVCTTMTNRWTLNGKAQITSGRYMEGPIGILVLSMKDERTAADVSEPFSTTPILQGRRYRFTVEKIQEWDNQVEAYVHGVLEGKSNVCFYAQDYFCNKELYKPGTTLMVELAALSLFMVHTEAAPAFVQRLGEIAMDGMSAVMSDLDPAEKDMYLREMLKDYIVVFGAKKNTPDLTKFISNIEDVRSHEFWGFKFYRGRLPIYRSDVSHLSDISIPVYFRKESISKVNNGDSLFGSLWFSGFVFGKYDQDPKLRKGRR